MSGRLQLLPIQISVVLRAAPTTISCSHSAKERAARVIAAGEEALATVGSATAKGGRFPIGLQIFNFPSGKLVKIAVQVSPFNMRSVVLEERPPVTTCPCSKLGNAEQVWRVLYHGHTVVDMITLLSAVGSLLSFRLRSRASLELELVALRHQVIVLRRQRLARSRLFSADRLLWVWLYRIWPEVLNTMGAGQTGNRRPVASQRLSSLLASAITPLGAAEDEPRDP
jgi:hypothetical protein